MKTICVYCGASEAVAQAYKDVAVNFGKEMGEQQKSLVYGGASVGLMGCVADAVLKSGQKVIGVIPQHILDSERKHEHLTQLHVVETMHERKKMMAEQADAFVVLPGGMGTLDEMFEILTWKYLRLHNKPVVILNVAGYWDHMIKLINNMVEEKFSAPWHAKMFNVVTDIGDVIPALEKMREKPIEEHLERT